jgi:hypothetical protein
MPKLHYEIAVLILTMVPSCVWSQNAPDTSGDTNQSWTSTDQQQNTSGVTNPTRTTQSHTESKGRTVDKQSVERLGSGGRYEGYLDTEKETVRVDATTVRTVQRTYGRDPDGRKTLTQVTEEEVRTLPRGEQKVVRTTSNPDTNGRLQVIQREIQESRQTSATVREMNTTMFTPNIDGSLAPTVKTRERQTQAGEHETTFQKSTSLRDSSGNWQVLEVRQGTVKEASDGSRTKEENVLRPNIEGNLAVAERTVSKDSASTMGEKRQTVETYSTEVPGNVSDGRLQLNQRVTTVQRASPDGRQSTNQEVEQRNPAAPSDGLRVTQKTIDIVRPGISGTTSETQTVQQSDGNGGLSTVWVDTRKTDKAPVVQVDTKKSGNSPAVQVNTGNSTKPQ